MMDKTKTVLQIVVLVLYTLLFLKGFSEGPYKNLYMARLFSAMDGNVLLAIRYAGKELKVNSRVVDPYLNPHLDAHQHLAQYCFKAGDIRSSLYHVREALRLDPDDKEMQSAWKTLSKYDWKK